MDKGGPSLHVDIVSAKSVNCNTDQVTYLQLHVLFANKVIRSSPNLCIATSDPTFDFSCDFSLKFLDNAITSASLAGLDMPVLIYVSSSTDQNDEENIVGASSVRTLLAAAVLDFRYCLLYSKDYVSVELLPCELDGCHMGLNGGLLFARLTLQNVPTEIVEEAGSMGTFRHEIEDGVHNYQHKLSQDNRDLYFTVKTWWAKVTKQYPYINGRVIKILTEDEIGCHRSVCSLIASIPPPRQMISPRHAARFVSLLPFKRDAGVTGGRVETWRSAHAVLARLQGDVEDHALLLCSLLLGWGMDAWVALGTIQTPSTDGSGHSQRPYCWVVTFDIPTGGEPSSEEPKVTFWEALSGQQYELPHPADDKLRDGQKQSHRHSFCELHCLFRQNCFMLNTQAVSTVPGAPSLQNGTTTRNDVASPPVMSFAVSNENNFALFPGHALTPLLRHPGCGLELSYDPLFNQSSYVADLEASIEKALRDDIARLRYEKNLYTNFDESLSVILQPVLASYELDRVVGTTFGDTDFQRAIRRQVRKGECFRAFPTCFSHCHPAAMISRLRRSEAALDVMLTSTPGQSNRSGGRGCRHGLRVAVQVYPEGIVAVWVMIAVCAQKNTLSSASSIGVN